MAVFRCGEPQRSFPRYEWRGKNAMLSRGDGIGRNDRPVAAYGVRLHVSIPVRRARADSSEVMTGCRDFSTKRPCAGKIMRGRPSCFCRLITDLARSRFRPGHCVLVRHAARETQRGTIASSSFASAKSACRRAPVR